MNNDLGIWNPRLSWVWLRLCWENFGSTLSPWVTFPSTYTWCSLFFKSHTSSTDICACLLLFTFQGWNQGQIVMNMSKLLWSSVKESRRKSRLWIIDSWPGSSFSCGVFNHHRRLGCPLEIAEGGDCLRTQPVTETHQTHSSTVRQIFWPVIYRVGLNNYSGQKGPDSHSHPSLRVHWLQTEHPLTQCTHSKRRSKENKMCHGFFMWSSVPSTIQ